MNKSKEEFIPYGKHSITNADIEEVLKVLKSDQITQGLKIPEFEESISKKVQSKHSISVNSATSALHLACIALGLNKNDYLWTSPISFVASANCGLYCGAKIDFIDINPNTGLICIEALKAKLEIADREGNLPKIIIPVHLAGTSCDMYEINRLSKMYGFRVIEDASHAIGGSYKSYPVGCCKFSDITVFSFHPVKIITTGEGGICTTNNEIIANKIRSLRSHGITKDESKFLLKPEGPWSYEQQELGYNYRITDFQAALGISQLNRLDKIIKERNEIFSRYQMLLKELPLRLLSIPNTIRSSVHLAIIRLNNSNTDFHKELFTSLRNKNIGVQLHYSPIHLQPYYRNIGFKKYDFPEAEKYATNSITIPLYPGLNEMNQNRVVKTLSLLLNE